MPVVRVVSPQLRLFLKFIRRLHFGRIEGVVVRSGVPLETPAPRFFCERKIGIVLPTVTDTDFDSYCRNPAVSSFITYVYELGDGVISSLEVQHGLPFKIQITGHGYMTEEPGLR